MSKVLKGLVAHRLFELSVLVIIIINSIALAAETLPFLSARVQSILVYIDLSCIGFFVVEAFLKLLAYRARYFKSGWNIFDFIITAVALLPFSHYVSVFRALRIIRAFRLIAHVPALKRVVEALVISIPGVTSTACLLLLVFFIFGVMGVKLFGGAFPEWFGHLGRSIFSLFQIMTLESWSMGIVRPVMSIYPYAWLYFIPFILISAFTLLNFLIGIMVDAIAHLKGESEASKEPDNTGEVLQRLERIEALLQAMPLSEHKQFHIYQTKNDQQSQTGEPLQQSG